MTIKILLLLRVAGGSDFKQVKCGRCDTSLPPDAVAREPHHAEWPLRSGVRNCPVADFDTEATASGEPEAMT